MCRYINKLCFIILFVLICIPNYFLQAREKGISGYDTPAYKELFETDENKRDSNLHNEVHKEYVRLSDSIKNEKLGKYELINNVAFRNLPKLNIFNFPKIACDEISKSIGILLACKVLGASIKADIKRIEFGDLQIDFSANTGDAESARVSGIINNVLVGHAYPGYGILLSKEAELLILRNQPTNDELNFASSRNVTYEIVPIALDGIAIATGKYVMKNNIAKNEQQKEIFGTRGMEKSNIYVRLLEGFFGIQSYNHFFSTSYYGYSNFNINPYIKLVSVDNVYPSCTSIKKKQYPFVYEIYAVIRKDEPANSQARLLRDWLLTSEGQKFITACGYVSIR